MHEEDCGGKHVVGTRLSVICSPQLGVEDRVLPALCLEHTTTTGATHLMSVGFRGVVVRVRLHVSLNVRKSHRRASNQASNQTSSIRKQLVNAHHPSLRSEIRRKGIDVCISRTRSLATKFSFSRSSSGTLGPAAKSPPDHAIMGRFHGPCMRQRPSPHTDRTIMVRLGRGEHVCVHECVSLRECVWSGVRSPIPGSESHFHWL